MLDRLRESSCSSATLIPDKTDRAELRVCRFGRMICEAPLRYDKCPQSLVGEGVRTTDPCGAVGIGGRSGAFATMGGLSIGSDGTSGVESAWRNLLSSCGLPTVDDAFPIFDDALPTAEDGLPTAEEGLPTAEEGGDEMTGLRGLLAWSPFAWKKTAGFFCGGFCSGACSLGDLTLLAWKNMGETSFAWRGSGGV